MPRSINVSQIRQAIYEASGIRGDGAPSTAVLGQWFHDGLGRLIGDSAAPGILATLADVDADLEIWKRTLAAESYARIVGPRLTREQAALRDAAPQVLAFWQASRAASDWLAELCWTLRSERTSPRFASAAPWKTLGDWMTTEEPLACELQEPGWSDSVRLIGVADAVVRLAGTGMWCAVELKLGQTSPEADLGQACLYHLLLTKMQEASGAVADAGTLALISFGPERQERVFSAHELATARRRLVDLIGKLAGVDQAQTTPHAGLSRPTSFPPVTRNCPAELSPSAEHLELGRGLIRTFAEYGVSVTLDQPVIVGPTFIRFPITLGRGTKVNAVMRPAAELQMRLQLKEEPFISRDNGQLVVDVQRPDPQTVYFAEIRDDLPRPDPRLGGSHIPVGVNLFRQLVCVDLNRTDHAHLLVAGTTGSGKSEWLRLALAGLLVTNTPETLRLLVIDPKRNAFHALRESPYLWRPLVFPDEQSAGEVLAGLAEEMDRRYRIADGADSFAQLANRSAEPLPRIVCVCDEYRDLISRSRPERKLIEEQICRLGAKARAAGIHLILATQEPSRDTIKGPLDANIPARVGLKMGKAVESRMLLNDGGAEKLLGHGDLLFKDVGKPVRLQAPLLTEAERVEIFERR